MMNRSLTTRTLVALICFASPALAEVSFETNYKTLGLATDASPASVQLTVEDITLTCDAGEYQLNDAAENQGLGITGNKHGQINGDETLTFRFDKAVDVTEINLGGLTKDGDGSPEIVVIKVPSLDLEWTLTRNSVTPETEGVEMGEHIKLSIKQGVLRLGADAELIVSAGSDTTTFNVRSLNIEAVEDGEPS